MPRTDPTEGRPATPALQLRARVDTLDLRGGRPWLHFVVELYERHGSKWTRLTCRTGQCTLEELMSGEDFLKGAKELEWRLDLNDEDPPP